MNRTKSRIKLHFTIPYTNSTMSVMPSIVVTANHSNNLGNIHTSIRSTTNPT